MADDSHHHHHHPDHHHGHVHHGHEDNESFTETNRKHWNDFAARYSSEPWQRDMLNKIDGFIHQHINWIGVDFIDPATTFEKPSPDDDPKRQVRVLDYACGPGTITHALGSHATEYVGVDLSENMVKAYNLRFNPEPAAAPDPSQKQDGVYDQKDETLNAHAVVGNLIDAKDASLENVSSPSYFNFDLVVVGLGFHHFQDIPLATSRLVERLKPGGTFLILDLVTHAMDEKPSSAGPTDGSNDAMQNALEASAHTVAHAGFSEEELKRYFGGAGLTDVGIVRMEGEVMLRGTTKRQLFLAKGRKT